jgi:hypothetical protein
MAISYPDFCPIIARDIATLRAQVQGQKYFQAETLLLSPSGLAAPPPYWRSAVSHGLPVTNLPKV